MLSFAHAGIDLTQGKLNEFNQSSENRAGVILVGEDYIDELNGKYLRLGALRLAASL